MGITLLYYQTHNKKTLKQTRNDKFQFDEPITQIFHIIRENGMR